MNVLDAQFRPRLLFPVDHGPFGLNDRLLNTIYRNLTGVGMFVEITVIATVILHGDKGQATLISDPTSPPFTLIGDVHLENQDVALDIILSSAGTITAFIPAGWYYDLIDQNGGTGTVSIFGWWEVVPSP